MASKADLFHDMFVLPQKKPFVNKRGPPSLQKDGNVSDTAGGEKQEQGAAQEEEGEEEAKPKKIVRWCSEGRTRTFSRRVEAVAAEHASARQI